MDIFIYLLLPLLLVISTTDSCSPMAGRAASRIGSFLPKVTKQLSRTKPIVPRGPGRPPAVQGTGFKRIPDPGSASAGSSLLSKGANLGRKAVKEIITHSFIGLGFEMGSKLVDVVQDWIAGPDDDIQSPTKNYERMEHEEEEDIIIGCRHCRAAVVIAETAWNQKGNVFKALSEKLCAYEDEHPFMEKCTQFVKKYGFGIVISLAAQKTDVEICIFYKECREEDFEEIEVSSVCTAPRHIPKFFQLKWQYLPATKRLKFVFMTTFHKSTFPNNVWVGIGFQSRTKQDDEWMIFTITDWYKDVAPMKTRYSLRNNTIEERPTDETALKFVQIRSNMRCQSPDLWCEWITVSWTMPLNCGDVFCDDEKTYVNRMTLIIPQIFGRLDNRRKPALIENPGKNLKRLVVDPHECS